MRLLIVLLALLASILLACGDDADPTIDGATADAQLEASVLDTAVDAATPKEAAPEEDATKPEVDAAPDASLDDSEPAG